MKKALWVSMFKKYGKLWTISLGHFLSSINLLFLKSAIILRTLGKLGKSTFTSKASSWFNEIPRLDFCKYLNFNIQNRPTSFHSPCQRIDAQLGSRSRSPHAKLMMWVVSMDDTTHQSCWKAKAWCDTTPLWAKMRKKL